MANPHDYTSKVSINDSRSILRTEDRKKWIALTSLPRDLRSQLEMDDDPSSLIEDQAAAKGTDKIKAWVRRTKKGFDVRVLKKKLTAKRDAYMQFSVERNESLVEQLTPYSPNDIWESTEYYALLKEKTKNMYELSSNSIHGMAGIPMLWELPLPNYQSSPPVFELEGSWGPIELEDYRPQFGQHLSSQVSSQSGDRARGDESEASESPFVTSSTGRVSSVQFTPPNSQPDGSQQDQTASVVSPPSPRSTFAASPSIDISRPFSGTNESEQDEDLALVLDRKKPDRSPLGKVIASYVKHERLQLESQEEPGGEDHESYGGSLWGGSERAPTKSAPTGDLDMGSSQLVERSATSCVENNVYQSQQPVEVVDPSNCSQEEDYASAQGENIRTAPAISRSTSQEKMGHDPEHKDQVKIHEEPEVVGAESALQTVDDVLDLHAEDNTPCTPDEEIPQLPQDEQTKLGIEAIFKLALLQLAQEQSLGKTEGKTEAKTEGKEHLSTELRGHRVSKAVEYETETDADPPSPSDRNTYRLPARHKVGLRGKTHRKRPAPASKTRTVDRRPILQELSNVSEGKSSTSECGPTIPKRLGMSDSAEDIWLALLQGQRRLLGVEHELVYKAKLDRFHSRRQGFRHCSPEDLDALCQSEQVATQNIGGAHPEVEAFSANLKTLRSLTVTEDNEETEDLHNTAQSSPTTPHDDSVRCAERTHMCEDKGQNASEHGEQGDNSATNKFSRQRSASLSHIQPNPNASVTASLQESRPARVSPIFRPSPDETVPSPGDTPIRMNSSTIFNNDRSPHEPRNDFMVLISLTLEAISRVALDVLLWLRCAYGPEPEVKSGEVRVRWTCSCGQQLYDDFTEGRPGVARELEAYLNRPRVHAGSNQQSPTTPLSYDPTPWSSMGMPPSSQSSWSSVNYPQRTYSAGKHQRSPTLASLPEYQAFGSAVEQRYLLTCANEDRFTPKVQHLSVPPNMILNDQHLALKLREHYAHVNRQWWKRLMKLRSLTKIEFVQFEMHKNR